MSHKKRQSYAVKWGMLLLATLVFVGFASVPTSAADDTAAISQGYKTEGEVTPGTIVSFDHLAEDARRRRDSLSGMRARRRLRDAPEVSRREWVERGIL